VRRRLATLAPAQVMLLALVLAVVVGAATVGVPVLGNAGILLACVAMFAALAVLGQWLWQSRQSTDWTNSFTSSAPPRGADSRINRLAHDVQQAATGDPVCAQRLHATLSGLAVERLRDRRGLTLEADPGAARAALGADLTAYLMQSPTTRVRAPQLAAFITTLEEL
jgi:hypothetical protein